MNQFGPRLWPPNQSFHQVDRSAKTTPLTAFGGYVLPYQILLEDHVDARHL
jgi:hypothetical protein